MKETNQSVDSISDDSHGRKRGASKEEIIVKQRINHFYIYCNYLTPMFYRKCSENSMRCEQMSIKCLEDSLRGSKHRRTKSLPTRKRHDIGSNTFIQHHSMNILSKTTYKNLKSNGVGKAWFTVFYQKIKDLHRQSRWHRWHSVRLSIERDNFVVLLVPTWNMELGKGLQRYYNVENPED